MELYDALWIVIPLWLFVDERLAFLVGVVLLFGVGITYLPEHSPSQNLTQIHATDVNTSAPSSDDTTDWH